MSFKDFYTKSKTVDTDFSKIETLRKKNDLLGARIEASKYVKDKNYVDIYIAMKTIQDNLGYMPSGFKGMRDEIDNDLLAHAKKRLGDKFAEFEKAL